ncbi:ribbon-helix-helix protein, CopG family [Ramlibacter humi]|uniref:ribbon-helix-helix protein, CopG family n=1 Tax=Ramlibacter humi TaxID=2530451 RepID=UPI003F6C534B
MELKTARITVLLDPTRKREFERVCRENDMTPSQVMRRLIREYMDRFEPAPRLLAKVPKAPKAGSTARLVKAARARKQAAAPAPKPARRAAGR